MLHLWQAFRGALINRGGTKRKVLFLLFARRLSRVSAVQLLAGGSRLSVARWPRASRSKQTLRFSNVTIHRSDLSWVKPAHSPAQRNRCRLAFRNAAREGITSPLVAGNFIWALPACWAKYPLPLLLRSGVMLNPGRPVSLGKLLRWSPKRSYSRPAAARDRPGRALPLNEPPMLR